MRRMPPGRLPPGKGLIAHGVTRERVAQLWILRAEGAAISRLKAL
jgi:hypothetical protein